MYIRFDATFEDGNQKIKGIFPVIGYLFDNYFVGSRKGAPDELRLREINEWFKYNLKLPDRIRQDSSDENKPPTALSWFKDTAHEHIKNLREVSDIIQRYGVNVKFVQTAKPGHILYEDEFQVFAEPLED